ncbi:hypothetical protein L1987_53995 [Smallanthus sonchifolius]|uniref:Uncharacterized protein n=1 Tax=Smallanthus sonchifolius TaxID=185202 RepID=A0ACB9E609_9ASTR|nr:hypothetical protein L1987_53995 [Smallanthus sonchifolius]
MDSLPHSVLLHILSLLDDSADVACCRVASKAFNTVFPGFRSINLDWPFNSSSRVSKPQRVKHFKRVFLGLISKLESVESVSLHIRRPLTRHLSLTDGDFAKQWLPRVSGSLKSLSISECARDCGSNVLQLLSEYCHNLVSLKLCFVYLHLDNLNPMPMLTSLTLSYLHIKDQHLNQLINCLPNLQVLQLHKISLFTFDEPPSLTLITPNLITLTIDHIDSIEIHVEAPMLSDLYLRLGILSHFGSLTIKKFESLKTLCIDSPYIGSILSEFPITKTMEHLQLDSGKEIPKDPTDLKLNLRKVFTIFPNMASLCICSGVWSELEACLNPQGWEILDGMKGLEIICAYLELADPSLTFSCVARVLDQCVGLLEVSLLIHADVDNTVSKSFMSKCMAHWPGLVWNWGIWSVEMEDSWITDNISN